jgi:hypothetical protein
LLDQGQDVFSTNNDLALALEPDLLSIDGRRLILWNNESSLDFQVCQHSRVTIDDHSPSGRNDNALSIYGDVVKLTGPHIDIAPHTVSGILYNIYYDNWRWGQAVDTLDLIGRGISLLVALAIDLNRKNLIGRIMEESTASQVTLAKKGKVI